MRYFLVGTLAMLLTGPSSSAFCSNRCICVGEHDTAKAMAEATAVFEGEALDFTFDAPMTRDTSGNEWYHVRIRVGHVWKGALGDTVIVQTPSPAGACGLSFKPGGRFLLFATGPLGSLSATICGLSQEWETADTTVAKLGAPVN
jgi:hypothetical protein